MSDPDFLPGEAVITTKARVNVCRDAIFIILKRVAFLVGHTLLLALQSLGHPPLQSEKNLKRRWKFCSQFWCHKNKVVYFMAVIHRPDLYSDTDTGTQKTLKTIL